MPVYLLSKELVFPPPERALENGLLAVGADLDPDRLLLAYRMGIFPWYSDGDPILWWSPNPRLVLYPHELRISGSLRKIIRQNKFDVTLDTAFERVINSCARIRIMNREETWITDEMIEAYKMLHEMGFAHSVETWFDGKLAGGLYGVSIGRCFFGESMFFRVSNASKVAFVKLVEHLHALSFDLVDCQMTTGHLLRFGAREIERKQFLEQLNTSLMASTHKGKWSFDL